MSTGTSRRGWLERLGIERPEARAWALYDWANSAVYTTIVGAVFPVYFEGTVAAGLPREVVQARFSYATAIALLTIALVSPVLGTLADLHGGKKRYLAAFVALGVLACCGLFFVGPGEWLLGLGLFALANVGVAGSIVFYDSLLPHVAAPAEQDRLSTTGYALGYVGGGLLLALNLLWIEKPAWFGLPHGEGLDAAARTLPARLAFLSVGIWWALFSIPLLLRVREPELPPGAELRRFSVTNAFRRLGGTLRELRRYRHAFVMLIAFLLYSDGIGTVIRMSTIYAKGTGTIDSTVILATFLVVQFVGVPCAILFGNLARRFGSKNMVLAGLVTFAGVCCLAYGMSSNWQFVLLGVLVGMVMGGTQALSRSLFSSLVPRHRSGEFFAFFSWSDKFAGTLGPLVFGLAAALGSGRVQILTIIPFFVLGGWLLTRVDVEAGRRIAAEDDAAVYALGPRDAS